MEHTEQPKRDERGRLLPGQRSINPKGRPPALPKEVKKVLDNLAEEAVQVVHETLRCDDPKLRFAAAQEILNRAFGKPVTMALVDLKTDGPGSHAAALVALAQMAAPVLEATPKLIDVTWIEETS
ncbi:hypothetical protein [Phyllobacterium zundukense]|uniref:DUF5681 domain-containing protein n=1 Tax=Phyllobacterium zundukense TaxID=1867719 RepID=A0A2N9W058_9HYPH|nr:hypothetical protein [Phyllobacterium zundukense]ATU90633.1 hypothetical protein BLM14_02395 [Phyllobacterium zundukense]PIO45126.1 hypothetical protein B5P45_08765 [Phyllobacterium zundukense]